MKCEGLPSGKPCPDNASGNNVYFRYAALDLCSPCEKEHRKANMLANEGKASSKADNGSLNKSASQRNNSIRGTSKGALQTHSHDDIVRPKTTSVCSEKLIIDPVLSYVLYSLQGGTELNIHQAVMGHFTATQICETKDILWEKC